MYDGKVIMKKLTSIIVVSVIILLPFSLFSADVETVILIKSMNDEKFIVKRGNGELWLLEAKTYCMWTWLKEGMPILAVFGYVTTTLVNPDNGDTCECWTEKQLR